MADGNTKLNNGQHEEILPIHWNPLRMHELDGRECGEDYVLASYKAMGLKIVEVGKDYCKAILPSFYEVKSMHGMCTIEYAGVGVLVTFIDVPGYVMDRENKLHKNVYVFSF